jgi:hypothetical protein
VPQVPKVPKGGCQGLAALARMEHTQDYQAIAVVSILEDVVAAEDLQDKLSVLLAPGYRATEFWMPREQLRSRDDRITTADNSGD